ncbi:hypothetical protein G6F31_016580 [Rhizopus arrhizus]|nr:hypothetical protein G6F31_016580 [Rhizopus arrhizus]
MSRYHIYLDADMLRNVLATDPKESRELMTVSLVWPVLLLAVLPMVVLWRVQLRRRSWGRSLLWRLGFLVVAAVTAVGGALISFQDVSALMRNQREVRYLATPANVLLGMPRALRGDNPVQRAPKLPIGTDAKATPRAPASKPRLLVIVMGETVRAGDQLPGHALVRYQHRSLAAVPVLAMGPPRLRREEDPRAPVAAACAEPCRYRTAVA